MDLNPYLGAAPNPRPPAPAAGSGMPPTRFPAASPPLSPTVLIFAGSAAAWPTTGLFAPQAAGTDNFPTRSALPALAVGPPVPRPFRPE